MLLVPSALVLAACGGGDAAPAPPEAPSCSIALPDPPDWRLTADGPLLRDGLGRVVLLRGANAGGRSKFAPFVPFDVEEGSFDEALDRYLDRAQAWGFSALRVPFSWAAVEPEKGVDDEAFLARYDKLLDAAWARRMYTIPDFHQDLYAEIYCGDGFPAWTVPGPHPEPHHDCKSWGALYQDPAVRSAFDRLWSDEGGTRTALAALWKRLSARHKDRPGVIGFEIINEPSPGSAKVKTWAPTVLTSFYTEMAALIHEEAPTSLVFFDATGTEAVGAETDLDKPDGQGLVFAPHYYHPAGLYGGYPSPNDARASLAKWAAQRDAWNIPLLVGESGVRRDLENANEFVTAMYDAMDEHNLHFTYWEYSEAKELWNFEDLSFIGADGSEAKAVLDASARPYPRAVAGEAPSFHYDAASHTLSLAYTAEKDGVTEIAVPARAYPSGYRVELSSGGCVDASRGDLLLVKAGSGDVTVKVIPR